MIIDLPTKRSDREADISKGLPTRWRRKLAGINMERNLVTVTLCIPGSIGKQSGESM